MSVTERELRIGTELIENLAAPFHPEQFRNEYRATLWEMIQRKAAGEKIKVVTFRPKEPTREDELVKVLEESLKKVRVRCEQSFFKSQSVLLSYPAMPVL